LTAIASQMKSTRKRACLSDPPISHRLNTEEWRPGGEAAVGDAKGGGTSHGKKYP